MSLRRSGRTYRAALVPGLVAAAALAAPAAPAVAGTTAPAAAAPATGAAAATGSFAETELWDATDTGDRYARMHVQALAVLHAGTPVPGTGGALAADVVLTVTEGRYTDSDGSKKDLLLRRSVDGGRTWSGSVVVVADDTPPGTDSIGSPSLLADEETGSAFLFWRGGGASMWLKRTDDAGLTWGAPVNLSPLYATNPNGWTSRSPTPGHGIQLSGGRLLMPVGHKAGGGGEPNYGDDVLYSDDHGATWRRSTPIFSASYPIGESRVFQRDDGAVVINGRWGSGGVRYRATAVSTDGGATWSAPVFDGAIAPFVSVDAGMTRFTRNGVGRLLLSRPDAAARENMTVSISYDDGASYRYSRVVNPGPSYYSDLAVLSDGAILLVYGRDGVSRGYPDRISAARFDLEWLTNGRDSLAGGPGFTRSEQELATAQARTGSSAAPQLVAEADARGGQVVRYAAPGKDAYVEMPFTVPTAGGYEVSVRHQRGSDRAKLRTGVDGVDLPYGRVDPTAGAGTGYQVYPLGTVALTAGTHWIRFTVVGPGRGNGLVVAPDQLLLTSGGPAADAPVAVADNGGQASFEMVGAWTELQEPLGYYGQFYREKAAGTGGAVARFRPDVPATGVYEVAVWYPAAADQATNAPYVVRSADGAATVRVNQRTEGSRWVVLGSYAFVAGDTATVELSDDANGVVVADAVRLSPVGRVADNDTAGFAQVSGAWNPATGVTGYWGHNYRTSPAGSGGSRVRWQPEVPVTGVYQVSAWYTADTNRASNAPYVVNHAGGSTTVRVDQRSRGSQWVPLGYFSFTAGTGTVELSGDADGYVVADAVRLVYQGVVADNAGAADDAGSGFAVVSGADWNTNASGVAGYYGTNYATSPAGSGASRARWQLAVPAAGVYQVAVWYTADPNRASNAPYVVQHAGGSTTVRVNQQSRGGQWVALGEFRFAAGTATVELSDDANGYVIADAVRLLPQRP